MLFDYFYNLLILFRAVFYKTSIKKDFIYQNNYGNSEKFTSLESLNEFLIETHGEIYKNGEILGYDDFHGKSRSYKIYEVWSY